MKLLIVDDHALIREAMRAVLTELDAGAQVIDARSAGDLYAALDAHPDMALILLDLALPDADGFDVLAELRERHPAIPVVVLSASNDRDSIARALELGAQGFVPKSAERDIMLAAFRMVFSGGVYVPPEILRLPPAATAPAPPRDALARLGLTARQIEVLELMMRGKSNKAICRTLGIAVPTVKNHVTAILRALNAANRTEAVIAAAALGAGRPPDDAPI